MTELQEVTLKLDEQQSSSFFDVFIDPTNSQNIYMPGETVLGSIEIFGKVDIHADGFLVSLVGEYYTIRGDEETCEIFSTKTSILDLKGAGEGLSKVNFSLTLNPDSPSSIATPCGGIKYRIIGSSKTKDQDGVLQNVEKCVHLSVIAPKQIENDTAGKREFVEERKFFYCCFGSISGDLEVTETALLCGSRAIINARIINTTNRHISMTAVSLVQKILRKKDMKFFKYEVSKVERGSIMPGKQQVWLAERFLIPSLPPSSSDAYFDVSYKIVMNIQKSSTKTLKIKIPVTIGNFMGVELPKSWKEPGGIQFWSYGEQQSMKVDVLPVYVTYCFL